MIKYLITASLLISSLLFACKEKSNNTNQVNAETPSDSIQDQQTVNIDSIATHDQSWIFDTLKVDKLVHIDNDVEKEGMQVDITFVYPINSPQNINLDIIQKCFSRLFLMDNKTSLLPPKAFEKINKKYTSDALEEGKAWDDGFISFSHYMRNKYFSIESVSPNFITTLASHYSYLGGAHGMSYIDFNSIDLKDGTILADSIIYKSGYKPALSKLIQNEVKRRNQSTNSDDEIMLLVELDEIAPNNNFYFSPKGIVYAYNQYEIAPYVQGIVEITISPEKIKPLLKDKYQYIVDDIKNKNIKSFTDNREQ